MAPSFNSCSFCNDIIASTNIIKNIIIEDYKHFFLTLLFVKTKEMAVKKFAFLLRPIFTIICRKYIAAF